VGTLVYEPQGPGAKSAISQFIIEMEVEGSDDETPIYAYLYARRYYQGQGPRARGEHLSIVSVNRAITDNDESEMFRKVFEDQNRRQLNLSQTSLPNKEPIWVGLPSLLDVDITRDFRAPFLHTISRSRIVNPSVFHEQEVNCESSQVHHRVKAPAVPWPPQFAICEMRM